MVVISIPYLSVARGHQGPASEHVAKKELRGAGVSSRRGKRSWSYSCMQEELATSSKGEPSGSCPGGVWAGADGCGGTQSLLLTSWVPDSAQVTSLSPSLHLQNEDDNIYFTWVCGHQKYLYIHIYI